MNTKQRAALEAFDAEHVGLAKGALSFAVIITRKLKSVSFPVDPSSFETKEQGQVKGLGGGAIKKILKEHGITRILSDEGGRTSRGNMGRLRAYVEVLNQLKKTNELNLDSAERFWIDRVNVFFDSKPFSFKLDPSKSLRFCVRHVLAQAIQRQREVTGTMFAGAVMQHLVGAKLYLLAGKKVAQHGFSVADAPSNRASDFVVGDVAIHVTTAPSEAVIRKCAGNLSSGLRPLIVTTDDGLGGARALAKQIDMDDRIDVIEFEQFLATNLYERSLFDGKQRATAVRTLIIAYNQIVDDCETDPSLKIEFDE